MSLLHLDERATWAGPCRLCGHRFCVDRGWLALFAPCGSREPDECPRCDPLTFYEMPITPQPWH